MMRLAILRVSGTEFDPDIFAARFRFSPDIVWRAGVPDRVGRVRAKPGFNLTIADDHSAAALVRRVCEWVETNKMALRALDESGGTAEIDVGLSVGAAGQFTASVTWAPSELALLAGCGVNLCVSAYPAGEEDEAKSGSAI
jgi:hypothetical protein